MSMTGRTEIVAIAEASPRPSEMVSNSQQLKELSQSGIVLPPATISRFTGDGGFHGIKYRWLPPDLSSYDLALEAGLAAIRRAEFADSKFSLAKVVAVLGASSSPDRIYSSMANRAQDPLGVQALSCEACDVSKGCGSMLYALILLDRSLRCIAIDNRINTPIYGLLVGGEAIGTMSNQPDSINYLLWGCGGVGLVLRYAPGPRDIGLMSCLSKSDGQYAHWTESVGIGTDPSYLGRKPNATMGEKGKYGRDIFNYLKQTVAPELKLFCRSCDIDPAASTSILCGHNPTYDGAKRLGEMAGFRPENVVSVADKRGNTSSVSPFLNYIEGHRQGLIKPGGDTVFIAYGAGFDITIAHYKNPLSY